MALPPPPRVPQPQVDRADLLDKMGIKPREPKRITPPAPQISTPVVAPPSIVTADPEWQKPQKQSNVFDIPVIGPLIDLIDTLGDFLQMILTPFVLFLEQTILYLQALFLKANFLI